MGGNPDTNTSMTAAATSSSSEKGTARKPLLKQEKSALNINTSRRSPSPTARTPSKRRNWFGPGNINSNNNNSTSIKSNISKTNPHRQQPSSSRSPPQKHLSQNSSSTNSRTNGGRSLSPVVMDSPVKTPLKKKNASAMNSTSPRSPSPVVVVNATNVTASTKISDKKPQPRGSSVMTNRAPLSQKKINGRANKREEGGSGDDHNNDDEDDITIPAGQAAMNAQQSTSTSATTISSATATTATSATLSYAPSREDISVANAVSSILRKSGSSRHNSSSNINNKNHKSKAISSASSSSSKKDDLDHLAAAALAQQDWNYHCGSFPSPLQEEEKKTDDGGGGGTTMERLALTRPFGRATQPLSPSLSSSLTVQVASAEWDAQERQWMYPITVIVSSSEHHHHGGGGQAQVANTMRSLTDFGTLQENLQLEFHGSLLLPLFTGNLTMAAATTSVNSKDMNSSGGSGPLIEAGALRDWLYDVLNGTRGQGEWTLYYGINIMQSDAVESFLYKHHSPVEVLEAHLPPLLYHQNEARSRRARLAIGDGSSAPGDSLCMAANSIYDEHADASFVQQVLDKSLDFFPSFRDFCVGPTPATNATYVRAASGRGGGGLVVSNPANLEHFARPLAQQRRKPYTSTSIGTARSLEIYDSFAEQSICEGASPERTTCLLSHPKIRQQHAGPIQIVTNWLVEHRQVAVSVLETCQTLARTEEQIGLAWKQVAVSLAHIFSYEKEVENIKGSGDLKVKRENLLYRKLAKETVEDCLLAVAKQKGERCTPSLHTFQEMLSAYIADLGTVRPSVDCYLTALENMALVLREEEELNNSANGDPNRSSTVNLSGNTTGGFSVAAQTYQQRALQNEGRLRDSLVQLGQSTGMRVARMVWWLTKTETTQCAALHAAASSLRTKTNVVSKSDLIKMTKRHLEEERVDDKAELDLVQRIMKNLRRIRRPSDNASVMSGSVAEDTEDEEAAEALAEEIEKLREQALKLVQQRLGKWNAATARAILEAVGIEEPAVHLHADATKELKLIRSYAAGLQDALNRCVQAVNHVKQTVTGANSADNRSHIFELRRNFVAEASEFFSRQNFSASKKEGDGDISASSSRNESVSALERIGVDMSDPLGWAPAVAQQQQQKNKPIPVNTLSPNATVGELFGSYQASRDAQTEWLLQSLMDLLGEYQERVDDVEGYLYMQFVGIKIEKYFNDKRTTALTNFERKTDISSAINVATRKKMPHLVKELQAKLDTLVNVSHTAVKESKELHLESKTLKQELCALAAKRLLRAREASTEKAIAAMQFWAKEEESCCASELKTLGTCMAALEKRILTHQYEHASSKKSG